MARELTQKLPDAGGLSLHDEENEPASDSAGGSFKAAAVAFGALYASITGFAIGGLEALSDRRAEARAARSRLRAAPVQARRLRGRAKRGSLA